MLSHTTKIFLTQLISLFAQHLKNKSYIVGYSLTTKDSAELALHFSSITSETPHTKRWATHICALTGFSAFSVTVAAPSSTPAAKAAPVAKCAADDDFDDVREVSSPF